MSLKLKLREKLDAAKGSREKMQGMLDTAGTAGRAMTDEERTQYGEHETKHAALMTECQSLKADIELSLVDIEADIEEMPSSEDILLQEADAVFA